MDNDIYGKLTAYLEGRLSGKERETVAAWLKDNGDDPAVRTILHDYWDTLSENTHPEAGRVAFERFSRDVVGFMPEHQKRGTSSIFRVIRNFAAVISVPLLLLSFFLWSGYNNDPELNYMEFSVMHGQKDSVRLPDNTVVWLNSGSRIIYPESFGSKSRRVFVSGEAYFDVEKDPKRPFVLSAGDVEVRVLGTEFNVTSYDNMESVAVSLIEGSVEVNARHDGVSRSVTLVPDDVLLYNKSTGKFEYSRLSTDGYCSWRDGGFFFCDQSLTEITTQFERVFNVKIFIHDPALRQARYTLAFVNNESLEQMLGAINFNGTMHITRDKDMIMITSK